MQLQQEQSEQPQLPLLAIIDGDAIPWMIGWHHREHRDIDTVNAVVDRWFEEFLSLNGFTKYIGVVSNRGGTSFRDSTYRYATYKGKRPDATTDPSMDWILFWKPIIVARLVDKWKFVPSPAHLETDDVVATSFYYNSAPDSGCTPVLCSPDKDLKQFPGIHFDYKKNECTTLSQQQANYNFYMQMLMGDTTDNIVGIPGMGPKKAELALATDAMMWETVVKNAYTSYFGKYYGTIIYNETYNTVRMVTPEHPMWDSLKIGFKISDYL